MKFFEVTDIKFAEVVRRYELAMLDQSRSKIGRTKAKHNGGCLTWETWIML